MADVCRVAAAVLLVLAAGQAHAGGPHWPPPLAGLVPDDRGPTYRAARLTHERLHGGEHWRFETWNGPVHVWRPSGYDPATAGTVLYVHGYYTDVDKAWREHRL